MEEEDFNSSESENDDQILLDEVTNHSKRKNLKDTGAVLNFDDDDDDSEESGLSDVDMGSDIEDRRDDLPDDRAWGQRRRNFYNTDYVDADYSGYNAEEAEAAEQEEQEGRNIQRRIMEQLTDADFSLEDFLEGTPPGGKSETIEKELSSMSRRQKLEYFQKESPEFDNLVNDFQETMKEVKKLYPIMQLVEDGTIVDWPAENYVLVKFRTTLTYCSFLLFYIFMKTQRAPMRDHPVLTVIAHSRLLLQRLQTVSQRFAPEVERILRDVVNRPEASRKQKKILTVLRNQPKKLENVKEEEDDEEEIPVNELELEDPMEGSSQGKRAITYEMAKNKGLTPKRKKEQRNPRVKHRNKFRKALVRRRGQVRTARKEIPVYGGEPSGIKIGLKKGRKFK